MITRLGDIDDDILSTSAEDESDTTTTRSKKRKRDANSKLFREREELFKKVCKLLDLMDAEEEASVLDRKKRKPKITRDRQSAWAFIQSWDDELFKQQFRICRVEVHSSCAFLNIFFFICECRPCFFFYCICKRYVKSVFILAMPFYDTELQCILPHILRCTLVS